MNIDSIFISGFRCFSMEGQVVSLNDLTCFVGPNASGKTATMAALAKMFGETQAERVIRSSDFHLMPGEKLDTQQERHLLLEIKLVFPELDGENQNSNAIPEGFNQMVVDAPEATPYCRIRLDATWTNDGTPTGEVQQKLSWILTPSDDPEVIEQNRRVVKSNERARIRVVYIPATRDPSQQIRSTTASVFGRLLRAIDWAGKDEEVRRHLSDLKSELGQLQGIGTMNANVQHAWNQLYDGRIASNFTFESVDADPSSLLDLLAPAFAPDEQGKPIRHTELSDGLRSLFALSLPLGLHRVEELLKTNAIDSGFQTTVTDNLPSVTLFAVEEPENHLSPHYLGKVVNQLLEVAHSDPAQVVLSSHSPAIMSRIEPDDVRYFLGGETRTNTQVRNLELPTDDMD
jgi:putative ATP-dependent endonuclease of the OLD family